MSKKPLITMIVPTYNTYEKYLIECMDSIKNVLCEDLEVIIVDDGSNQETKDILERYADLYNIIHQENGGIIAARLTGLNNANGEYILFLDSDDIIDKNGIKTLKKIIDEYQPDVINRSNIRFRTSIKEIVYEDHFFEEGLVDKTESLRQLCMLHINGIGNKVVKKEIYDGMINHIDSSIINGEDLQQSAYVLLKANKIYHTNRPIDYYRFNEIYREYYGDNTISDINFLVPAYNLLFVDTHDYDELLPVFKQSCANNIVYNGFKLSSRKISNKEKKKLLDKLNEQKAVKIIKDINANMSALSTFLFSCLTNKHYNLFIFLAFIFKHTYGLDKSTNQ